MTELDKWRKIQGAARASLTRILSKMDAAIQDQDVQVIKETLHRLEVKSTEIDNLDTAIMDKLAAEDDIEAEYQGQEDYREKLQTCQIKGQEMVDTLSKVAVTQDARTAVTPSTETSSKVKAKLPKMDIAKYNGDVYGWQTFWDQFSTSVHDNQSLATIDKFSYLKTFLIGQAADSIAGLSVTEANYSEAIDLIKIQFGRPELLGNAYMQKLLDLQPIKGHSYKASDLRKLYCDCQAQIRSLKALGVQIDGYGGLLFAVLTRLLPQDVLKRWCRVHGSEKDVLKLLNFLKTEVESKESLEVLCSKSSSSQGYKELRGDDSKADKLKMSTASALPVGVEASKDQAVKKSCIFCGSEDHKSWVCTADLEVQVRREKVKKLGLCYLCLGGRHRAFTCKRSWNICSSCKGKHHQLLCEKSGTPAKASNKPAGNVTVTGLSQVKQMNVDQPAPKTILLKTARIWACGPTGRIRARCLLDDGSQRSYICTSVCKKLGLSKTGEEHLTVHAFGSRQPAPSVYRRFILNLEGRYGGRGLTVELLEAPIINAAKMPMPDVLLKQQMKNAGFLLADDPEGFDAAANPEILIGSDYYWEVVTGKTQRLNNQLVTLESEFGWLLNGPGLQTEGVKNQCGIQMCVIAGLPEEELQTNVFWDMEVLGIKDETNHQKRWTQEEQQTMEFFEKTITTVGGRYNVRIPWRPECQLDDNRATAWRRFCSLIRSLKRNPDLRGRYFQAMQHYLDDGHAEVAPEQVAAGTPVYFLPHHAIIKDDRITTKLRIVFDASSHAKGCSSLNDCIFPGPRLQPDIPGMLLRFRRYEIAMVADVEKAFLQIGLAEPDRDATRFFWVKPGWNFEGEIPVVVLRMTRVLFGVNCSPFLLNATIRYHASQFKDTFPVVSQLLEEDTYVDDVLAGSTSVPSAKELHRQIKEVMDLACMPLKKWATNNCDYLRNHWFEIGESQYPPLEKNSTLKLLGLKWDPLQDVFLFSPLALQEFLRSQKATKRTVLQTVSRVFDPLGFLLPFTITLRILFQELWLTEIPWDEVIGEKQMEVWEKWKQGLDSLVDFHIKRHLNVSYDEGRGIEFHVFCDASPQAYGAAVYSRRKNGQDSTEVRLLCSRARVAPIKRISLPRMELLAALIGARLGQYVKSSLKMEENQIWFWSDSTITLHWLKGKASQWKTYVANRVQEIQELTKLQVWRYCSGDTNPADCLTRGLHTKDFLNRLEWWNGPSWLQAKKQWPRSLTEIEGRFAMDILERRTAVTTVTVNAMETKPPILNLDNYSNLFRVLRITAWVFRFLAGCRSKGATARPLTAQEIEMSLVYWVKVAQRESFPRDLLDLEEGKPPRRNQLWILNAFLDEEGVIRVKSRLQHPRINEEVKTPILLPMHHRLTDLLIDKEHKRLLHAGIRDTFVELRSRFWIIAGRQAVKKRLHHCLVCRKMKVKATSMIEAPLPQDRVVEAPAFNVSGVDFAGPLYVKQGKGELCKAYIALFFCAVTRAIHLELVSSMSTDAFLLALRRFFARRGVSQTLFSDNALTFKRMDKELGELWKAITGTETQQYFGKLGVRWKFIAEKAAWWGGFYERMVRLTKDSLKKVLGRASLLFEEVTTVLTEVEAMLNSRPISVVYSDLNDEEPLTPSHFLIGSRLTTLPTLSKPAGPVRSDEKSLARRWAYRARLMQRLWVRWREDYLQALRTAHSTTVPKVNKTLAVGDFVLVHDRQLPRHMWKMGRVAEVLPGRDGNIRACQVRVGTGQLLRRPVQLLYPLEIS